MANKYLEKIAIIHIPLGAIGADKGDRIGGGLIGGTVGAALGAGVGSLAGTGGAGLGYLVGGYLGGKGYSKVKDNFRSAAEMKAHLKRNSK